MYRYHTGWVGGLKEIPARELLEKHPERILKLAVSKMLPRNRLRRGRLSALKIYPGEIHPHTKQFPLELVQSSKQKGTWKSFDRESQHFPNTTSLKDMD